MKFGAYSTAEPVLQYFQYSPNTNTAFPRKYAHDLGLAVFDKDLKMRVKVDLAFARSQNNDLLKVYEEKLHSALRTALQK